MSDEPDPVLDPDAPDAAEAETPQPLEPIEVDTTINPKDPNVVLPDPNAEAPEADSRGRGRSKDDE